MRSIIKIDHICVADLESLCLFGKLEWLEGEAKLEVSFKGIECNLVEDLLKFIEKGSFVKNDVIKFPCFYARYKNFSDKKEFNKAIRQVFGIAIATFPKNQ